MGANNEKDEVMMILLWVLAAAANRQQRELGPSPVAKLPATPQPSGQSKGPA